MVDHWYEIEMQGEDEHYGEWYPIMPSPSGVSMKYSNRVDAIREAEKMAAEENSSTRVVECVTARSIERYCHPGIVEELCQCGHEKRWHAINGGKCTVHCLCVVYREAL